MHKSVTRRIIALIFSVCGAVTLTYLAITGNNEAMVALIAIVGTITGFYFGTKAEKL